MTLERPTCRGLTEAGWKLPETFVVKAADGVTDLYGNMWKPFDFDPKKTYPIIVHVYPGPQQEGTTHTFSAVERRAAAGADRLHRHPGRPPRRDADPVQGLPQLRLLQPPRLRPGRQEGRHRAARRPAPVHRHQPGRHLRPLRRRLHDRRGHAPEAVQRVLQGRRLHLRQPRQQHLRRLLGRDLPRPEGGRRQRRGQDQGGDKSAQRAQSDPQDRGRRRSTRAPTT